MSRPARITVLCEDLQQACFVRRFLLNRGWTRHEIRENSAPQGRGSGEQYVREGFPDVLKAYRRKADSRTGLIVVIDADTQEVADRVRAFNSACKGKGVEPRQKNEKVLYVIPKRNIETWLAYLRGETCGKTVDEEEKFPKHEYPSQCHPAADKLDAMCKAEKLDPVPPPSLERCCDEFKVFWRLVQ